MGGPDDGEVMECPDGGTSMDVILDPLPEAFTRQVDPTTSHLRVARVPIIRNGGKWYAMWNDRVERNS